MIEWIYLGAAGIFEVGWAVGLKYTDGFTKPLASVATAIFMVLSFFFLSMAMKNIQLGTAYAVWTGIGTAGTAIAGIILFAEPYQAAKLVSILLIIAGIAGLKVFS